MVNANAGLIGEIVIAILDFHIGNVSTFHTMNFTHHYNGFLLPVLGMVLNHTHDKCLLIQITRHVRMMKPKNGGVLTKNTTNILMGNTCQIFLVYGLSQILRLMVLWLLPKVD